MTSERDIDRVLDRWFTEPPTEVSERVLEEVADQIGRVPQRPAWLPRWRDSHMSNSVKALAAIAAAIVIAVGGWYLLPGRLTTSSEPSPTPSPELLSPGPLREGAYRTDAIEGVEIAFTVPVAAAGWEAGDRNFIGKPPFVDAPNGVYLGFSTVSQVSDDPCENPLVPKAVGDTVDDIATVWMALPHAQVAGPAPIDVSGFGGVRFELTVDDDLSECEAEAISLYYADEAPAVRVVGAGQQVELWAIDVDGTRLIVEASSFPGASPSDVDALDEVLSSIRLHSSD